jgi:hypothetical protein
MSITIRNDHLGLKTYSDQYICKNGETLHFYFDRMDSKNIDFWWNYATISQQARLICDYFCKSIKEDTYPSYPNIYSTDLEYSEEKYYEIVKFIQRKGYYQKLKNPFRAGGFGGDMEFITREMSGGGEKWKNKKVYVVFATTTPVNSENKPHFNQIKMSVLWISDDQSRTVQHIGIFRPPSDFLDPDEKYRGIAIPLHKFAATVALTQFHGKEYMITHPMYSMAAVMSNILQQNLHFGTNLDLLNIDKHCEKDQELLKKHPPIIHLQAKTGSLVALRKIAKEDTNLSEYLESSLPTEKTEITLKENEPLMHYSPATTECFICAIKLTKLAQSHFER